MAVHELVQISTISPYINRANADFGEELEQYRAGISAVVSAFSNSAFPSSVLTGIDILKKRCIYQQLHVHVHIHVHIQKKTK